MKRTISIKLQTTKEQNSHLSHLQEAYLAACNDLTSFVTQHRCWNRVALDNLSYSHIRSRSLLGSQMVCNAIFAVCKAYKSHSITPEEEVPVIRFHKGKSIHFDK